jgi:hypothetical protein
MDKLLKSPNSPNIDVEVLTGDALAGQTAAEILEIRIVEIELSRTPIVVISKTTNIS